MLDKYDGDKWVELIDKLDEFELKQVNGEEIKESIFSEGRTPKEKVRLIEIFLKKATKININQFAALSLEIQIFAEWKIKQVLND